MTQEEYKKERHMFDRNLNLDFMMESDEEKDDVTKFIIERELTKTPYQKVEDHRRFDADKFLMCDSVNGFIRSVVHLLSGSKKFVRFFLRENYTRENPEVVDKPYCKMLDDVFSKMWRN
jgi:hypothetical protein